MKSGNLNFLEPSGPLQACNGAALPLPTIKKRASLSLETFIVTLRIRSNPVITISFYALLGTLRQMLRGTTSYSLLTNSIILLV